MKNPLTVVGLAFLSLPLAAQQKPPTTAERVNTAVSQLDTWIHSALAQTKVPGLAVAVIYKDKVLLLRGYGLRKIGDSAKVDPDTVFEIASVSKPIASTILASLVGQGKISWDDRITALDPSFKLSNPDTTRLVTMRDFLSHRSGLPTESGDMLEDLGYSRPEILEKMRYLSLPGQLGKSYAYSNFGFTTAAIAAAKKIGHPWETIAQEQLYGPLGMTSTSSRFSDYRNRTNKAAMHIFVNGRPVNRFVRDADAEAPAGGVSSSIRDLAQWALLQLNGGKWNGKQLVDANALAETHKPAVCRTPAEPANPNTCPGGQYYALGWNVSTDSQGRQQLGHSGAFFLGAATSIYIVPDERLSVIALSNALPVGLPETICLDFLDLVHYGKPQRDYLALAGKTFAAMMTETQKSSPDYATLRPPKKRTPPQPLQTYAGKYSNQYFGTLEVSVEGGRLILRLPPRGSYYELTNWDGDTFTYYFASENTGMGRRGAKFSPAQRQVRIESLGVEYDPVFTRLP
jgi:CubicO group peptidase (beta-lactamase class C family)